MFEIAKMCKLDVSFSIRLSRLYLNITGSLFNISLKYSYETAIKKKNIWNSKENISPIVHNVQNHVSLEYLVELFLC